MATALPETFICKGCKKEFAMSDLDMNTISSTEALAKAASGEDPTIGIYCDKCYSNFSKLKDLARRIK